MLMLQVELVSGMLLGGINECIMHIVNNTIDMQSQVLSRHVFPGPHQSRSPHKVGCDNGLTLSSQWVCSVVTVFLMLGGLTGSSLSFLFLSKFVIAIQLCKVQFAKRQSKCVKYNLGNLSRYFADVRQIIQDI